MITLWIKPEYSDGQFLVIRSEKLRSRQHIEQFLLDNFDSRNTLQFERKVFGSKNKIQNYSEKPYETERLKIGEEEIEFAWITMTEEEYNDLSEFGGW